VSPSTPHVPRARRRRPKPRKNTELPNLVSTTCSAATVQLRNCELADATVTFGGADVFAEGTILARDSVSLKYVLFVKGGSTNQNGIPKAVLAHRLESAGSGDQPARVIVAGELVKERLVIDADGNDSNVDAAVLDQLRDYGLRAVSVKQLAKLDN
jgi:Bacteriophage lambda head decoration protein D